MPKGGKRQGAGRKLKVKGTAGTAGCGKGDGGGAGGGTTASEPEAQKLRVRKQWPLGVITPFGFNKDPSIQYAYTLLNAKGKTLDLVTDRETWLCWHATAARSPKLQIINERLVY